ncbi:hypothetical protein AB0D37_42120 [Streptomyces sp. NPDC048384]|uniref:hypothetical protein n=1 Tax=Streptomyces sp. NPDC048384 TaxID=3155487 RepID=UPI00342706FC
MRGRWPYSLCSTATATPGISTSSGGQYTLVRRGTGFKLRFHAQAHCIDIHFTDIGVLLVGWVRDAAFGSFEYGPEWQEMLDQIPEPLKALPFDPNTTTGFRTGGKPDLPFVSCVMWRLPEDDA